MTSQSNEEQDCRSGGGVQGRPSLGPEERVRLAVLFGLEADGLIFEELPAYEDLNFRVTAPGGQRYVLKAHNALLPSGSHSRLEAQNRIIHHLRGNGLPVPEVVSAPTGECILQLPPPNAEEPAPLARMLTYLEGHIVPNDQVKTSMFLKEVGETCGRISSALVGLDSEGFKWTWDWDMKQVPNVVRSKLSFVKDESRRELASRLADEYEALLSSTVLEGLPHSVIHADLNDTNLLFERSDGGKVVGILDFGDSIYSVTAFEPAIAAGYYSLGQPDPMGVIADVLKGYTRTAPTSLCQQEVLAFFQAARGRVLLSVCMSAYMCSLEPDNEYLAHTAEPGWAVLHKLGVLDPNDAVAVLSAAVSGGAS